MDTPGLKDTKRAAESAEGIPNGEGGQVSAGWGTCGGLFLVTLSTLMYEILLTRIFSVSMRYHFAFMAISVALFGITLGATLVYLAPRYFEAERAKSQLALSALLFGVWMVLSLAIHLQIPNRGDAATMNLPVILTYLVISVPFVFGGICITLVLTRFPRQISSLYGIDLLGSSLGCAAIVGLLKWVDGLNAVVVCGFLAGAGSILFALDSRRKRVRAFAAAGCLLLGAFLVLNFALTLRHASPLEMKWVKGHKIADPPLYEKWNSFSRILVYGNPDDLQLPVGMGVSPNYRPTQPISRLQLDIDSDASTEMARFTGDLAPHEYLKYDVVNMVHHLRKNADVCVIGSGGGRDILSALAFDQKSILGIEINEEIVKAVDQEYGDYTGHLDRNPKVNIVADEARSYITRSKEPFDIIQVSMIDTWAATAAGAFVLSENSLYTVEAWSVFLERLKPNGILSFCRWYYVFYPGEMYRLVSLARAALLANGAEDPRDHMILIRCLPLMGETRRLANGLGVLLVSRDPFSLEDLREIQALTDSLGFELVLAPNFATDPNFALLASADPDPVAVDSMLINANPPTDDSPFFFNMLTVKELFDPRVYQLGALSFNLKAVKTLGVLLVTVTVLSVLFILIPLAAASRHGRYRGSLSLFMFFAAIGLGFMMIEVSQMQRLIIFLGHPSYGLTVILFSLLLGSGLGSMSTRAIDVSNLKTRATTRLGLLFLVVTLFGFLTMWILPACRGAATPVRVGLAILLLFPMGFLMGNAFPLGMKAAGTNWGSLTPILFGVNGAMSVFASVLAVVIALLLSISTSFWVGALCYLVAYLAFGRILKRIG